LSKDSQITNFSALDFSRKSPQIAKTTNYTPALRSPKQAQNNNNNPTMGRPRILDSHYLPSDQKQNQ
jgi:hypothetical protein